MIKTLSISAVLLLTVSACNNKKTPQPLNQDAIKPTVEKSALASEIIKPATKAQEKNIDMNVHAEIKSNYVYVENNALIVKVDHLKNDDLRYTAWNKPKSVSDKPDLVLYKGKSERQGTQGGSHYTFKNGSWDYIIEENPLGDTVSAGTILRLVHKGKEKLYSQMTNLKHDGTKVDIDYKNMYCENEKLVFKIDTLTNGDRRYTSWNKPKSIHDKPDLVLHHGQTKRPKSFDGYIYEFKNGTWNYIVEEHDAEGNNAKVIMLKLLKDGKQQLYTKMSDAHQSYNPEAPIDALDTWLKRDTPQQKIINKLGNPDTLGEDVLYDAIGLYVQEWEYKSKGVYLSMASKTKGSDKQVLTMTISKPSLYKTAKNIGIGAHRNEVIDAYFEHIDDKTYKLKQIIAGSVYDGTFFDFKGDKVSRIFIGAGAE